MDYPSLSLIVRDGKRLGLSHLASMEPDGWKSYVERAVSQRRWGCLCQQRASEQQLKSYPLLTRQTALGRRFATPWELSRSHLACPVSKAALPSAWPHCVGSQSLSLATFLLDVGRASSPGQTGSAEAPFTWRLLPLGTFPFAHILQPISTHSKEPFEWSDTLINPHLSLGRSALNGELVLHRHYHFLLTQCRQDPKRI